MDPRQYPDQWGRFGEFGGKYAPEVLMPALEELEAAYARYKDDPEFLAERRHLEEHYVGRASLLRGRANARSGRGSHLPEARRSRTYRRAQDQQRARAGIARKAHGQA